MKSVILLPILLATATAATFAADPEGGILPNPSFEKSSGERPRGWQVFLTPAQEPAPGAFFVAHGQEGTDTHSGASALLFSFPDSMEIAQAMWMADPTYGGASVEPGHYVCSFWTRTENLPPQFHLWVSIVGFGADGKRIGEVGRSEYLDAKKLDEGTWSQIRFPLEVTPGSGITRLAPTVVLKAQPSGDPVTASPDLRVLVDDLQIHPE